jgi:hypothetical protein
LKKVTTGIISLVRKWGMADETVQSCFKWSAQSGDIPIDNNSVETVFTRLHWARKTGCLQDLSA